mgnify:CR=1 FL=1
MTPVGVRGVINFKDGESEPWEVLLLAKNSKVKTEQPTFEQAMHALEEAVAKLEKGDLPLDQALDCFTVGVEGASRCRELLKDVETRIEQLLERADGSQELKPFADGRDEHA